MSLFARPATYGVLIIVSIIFSVLLGIWGPFNGGAPDGGTTTEIFLPAGYVFSIWAVIYVGLIALGVWMILPAQADNPRIVAAAPWLFATAFGNAIWISFASSIETVPWTVPALIFMEITAWIAYFRLGIGDSQLLGGERWLYIPIQLYVGWLSVATVANTAAALNVLGWSGWGLSPVTWTLIMLVIATVIGVFVGSLVGEDNIYRGVFVWAFIGIMLLQTPYPSVVWTSGSMALLIVLVMIFSNWIPIRDVLPA